MMMSDLFLPADLVEEILSRVPATCLKRLRSTCKQWDTLFKDPRFAEKHFCHAPKQSFILMLKDYKVFSMSVNLNVAPPSTEFKGGLGLKDPHSRSEQKQVDISEVFYCDGLLLCKSKDSRLVVWNPCLGETRWIQPKTAYKKFARFALGFQNNKSGRSYKILRYWRNDDSDNTIVECEIYEFSSNTWRVLGNTDFFTLKYGGVSLKGNSYWLASQNEKLFCFDFTTERFRCHCLPPSQNHNFTNLVDSFTALSVVREEQLSLLHRRTDISKMEIWMTNKFDSEASLLWRKFVTLDLHVRVCSSLVIDEEKKVALCWDIGFDIENNKVYTIGEDNEYYSEISFLESIDKPWWWPFIINFVPSLVQIQRKE